MADALDSQVAGFVLKAHNAWAALSVQARTIVSRGLNVDLGQPPAAGVVITACPPSRTTPVLSALQWPMPTAAVGNVWPQWQTVPWDPQD